MAPKRHPLNVALGALFRERRKKVKHLSQGDVGRIIGLTGQQYARYEAGEATFRVTQLPTLLDTLQVNVDCLIDLLRPNDDPPDPAFRAWATDFLARVQSLDEDARKDLDAILSMLERAYEKKSPKPKALGADATAARRPVGMIKLDNATVVYACNEAGFSTAVHKHDIIREYLTRRMAAA